MEVTPRIESNKIEMRNELVSLIKGEVAAKIKKPVFRGFNVFSREECNEEVVVKVPGYQVKITQRKVHEVGSKPSVFMLFLNVSLRGIMSRLKYVEIGRSSKYFLT